MSVYIPVELQRKIRTHFSYRCAYCQTAEALTVAIFEIEVSSQYFGGTRSEPVEDRWFRQAQPTLPQFIEKVQIEHSIPRSAQGQTVFENLCLACPTCNRYKANRQEALDPVSNEMVPLFHPHLQNWTDHFAWSQMNTEIVGLSPIGRATISALKVNRPQIIRVRQM